MSTLGRFLSVAGTVMAGCLAGFMLGQSTEHDPKTQADAPVAAGITASARAQNDDAIIEAFRDALATASQPPGRLARQRGILAALDGLTPADMPSALGAIQSLDEDERSRMLPAFFARWAEFDPVAAIKRASIFAEYARSWEVSAAIYGVWAKTDAEAAATWVRAIPNKSARIEHAVALSMALAADDPDHALRYLGELGRTNLTAAVVAVSEQPRLYYGVFGVWAETAPESAAARALGLPYGAIRTEAISAATESWAARDGRAALAWAVRLPEPGVRNAAVYAAICSLCERDPHDALARVMELPASPSRDAWLTLAISKIAPEHPEMAIELASLVPAGSSANRTLVELTTELAKSDGASAVALLETLPAGDWRNEASTEIAKQWALQDRDAALAWAGQLSGKARGNAVFDILVNWSESDPAAAVAWASAHGENGSLPTLGTAWARTDPEAAITWAQALPKDGAREEIIARLVQGVTHSDPARAGQLIATELRGEMQADAARILHQTWREDDATAADRWFRAMPSFSPKTKNEADRNER